MTAEPAAEPRESDEADSREKGELPLQDPGPRLNRRVGRLLLLCTAA
eukprot:CAMPEP_0195312574 /NCGR_PEP_ID=MMETSP0708-20121125/1280_1 /TAXON_ID=33640 /ORGANISM="Asterionellopsis glacialis, Strain CCMP134" /LENGTH=46 /DNA_ID= /DNA_START= /DNA_END= /DNA_ORIENTATION=